MIIRFPMTRLVAAASVAASIVAVVWGVSAQARGRTPDRDGPTLDQLLGAYLAGETDVVAKEFTTSLQLQTRLKLTQPKDFEKWLGAYEPGKAVFVLALARIAANIGPQYTPVLLRGGERYVNGRGTGDRAGSATPAFARDWHRIAVGLLQGQHHGAAIEQHLAGIDPKASADPRLVLARAIAQEINCWEMRPVDQPSVRVTVLAKEAGTAVKKDLDGLTTARRAALVTEHYKCLTEGISRFDDARGAAETRAEAAVRGGWLLVQQTQFQDAIAWLDAANPETDTTLAYWRDVLRGRALSGLSRHHEAAEAYRDAFKRFPGAQTAGLGLALELFLSDEAEEADRVARALRLTAASAVDPWTTYREADWRFVDAALEALRKQVAK